VLLCVVVVCCYSRITTFCFSQTMSVECCCFYIRSIRINSCHH
jgi:hypothetical protein